MKDASAESVGRDWVRPRPDASGYRRDALAAALLLVGCLFSLVLSHTAMGSAEASSPGVGIAWAVCVTLPLALRRRFPGAVAVVVVGVFIAGQALVVPEALICNITVFLALYTLGAWGGRRQAFFVRWSLILVVFAWLFIALARSVADPGSTPSLSRSGAFSPFTAVVILQLLSNLLYFGAAYYFGNTSFASARARHDLEARTAQLESQRAHSAAQAVVLERVRIARELHDVVAHHVSVMGIQAAAARRVLKSDAAKAETALAAIEESSRTAVDELRKLLGALRSEPGPEVADAPSEGASTLGVGQLPGLAQAAGAAGLPTRYEEAGERREVPATLGFALYRIAQEALTNSRKHAGRDARASMLLRYSPGGVELVVSDDGGIGPPVVPSPAAQDGLGHTGIRERANLAGGEVEYGPNFHGGYVVRARFPLGDGAPEATSPPAGASARPGARSADDPSRVGPS